MEITRFDSIDSTQLHARRELEAGRAGGVAHAWIARAQTAGVGQRASVWHSPAGGLWMTVSVPLRVGASPPARLALEVGHALLRCCRDQLKRVDPARAASLRLKWPNDLMIDDLKVGGILTEVITVQDRRFVLVGVGINWSLCPEALPPELSGVGTSLLPPPTGSAEGAEPALEQFGVETAREIESIVSGQRGECSENELYGSLWRMGEEVEAVKPDGSVARGKLVGISPEGGLQLVTGGQVQTLLSARLSKRSLS